MRKRVMGVPGRLHEPLGDEKGPVYSNVVIAEGTPLFLAGQVAVDPQGRWVGDSPADINKQVRQVMENIKAVLEGAGAAMKDVVKLTILSTDIEGHLTALRSALREYFPEGPVATTMIQVVRLARRDCILEIEAIAVIPPKAR